MRCASHRGLPRRRRHRPRLRTAGVGMPLLDRAGRPRRCGDEPGAALVAASPGGVRRRLSCDQGLLTCLPCRRGARRSSASGRWPTPATAGRCSSSHSSPSSPAAPWRRSPRRILVLGLGRFLQGFGGAACLVLAEAIVARGQRRAGARAADRPPQCRHGDRDHAGTARRCRDRRRCSAGAAIFWVSLAAARPALRSPARTACRAWPLLAAGERLRVSSAAWAGSSAPADSSPARSPPASSWPTISALPPSGLTSP